MRTEEHHRCTERENVYPEELEEKIMKIPFVLECVVFGFKNAKGDEEIGVIIVPNAEKFIQHTQQEKIDLTGQFIENTLNEEIRKLNHTLPGHQVIRRVKIQEREFEKTTTQKIKRYLIDQEDSTH